MFCYKETKTMITGLENKERHKFYFTPFLITHTMWDLKRDYIPDSIKTCKTYWFLRPHCKKNTRIFFCLKKKIIIFSTFLAGRVRGSFRKDLSGAGCSSYLIFHISTGLVQTCSALLMLFLMLNIAVFHAVANDFLELLYYYTALSSS